MRVFNIGKMLLQFLFVEFWFWRHHSRDFSKNLVSCNQLNPKNSTSIFIFANKVRFFLRAWSKFSYGLDIYNWQECRYPTSTRASCFDARVGLRFTLRPSTRALVVYEHSGLRFKFGPTVRWKFRASVSNARLRELRASSPVSVFEAPSGFHFGLPCTLSRIPFASAGWDCACTTGGCRHCQWAGAAGAPEQGAVGQPPAAALLGQLCCHLILLYHSIIKLVATVMLYFVSNGRCSRVLDRLMQHAADDAGLSSGQSDHYYSFLRHYYIFITYCYTCYYIHYLSSQ